MVNHSKLLSRIKVEQPTMLAATNQIQQTENNAPEFVIYKGLRVYQDGKIERKLKKAGWREIPNRANNKGYNCIRMYDRKMFKRHRIVKAAYTPEFNIDDPKQVIDHIDHDTINNSLRNLRVVSQQGNQWNRKGKGYSLNKTSGFFAAILGSKPNISGLLEKFFSQY